MEENTLFGDFLEEQYAFIMRACCEIAWETKKLLSYHAELGYYSILKLNIFYENWSIS